MYRQCEIILNGLCSCKIKRNHRLRLLLIKSGYFTIKNNVIVNLNVIFNLHDLLHFTKKLGNDPLIVCRFQCAEQPQQFGTGICNW